MAKNNGQRLLKMKTFSNLNFVRNHYRLLKKLRKKKLLDNRIQLVIKISKKMENRMRKMDYNQN